MKRERSSIGKNGGNSSCRGEVLRRGASQCSGPKSVANGLSGFDSRRSLLMTHESLMERNKFMFKAKRPLLIGTTTPRRGGEGWLSLNVWCPLCASWHFHSWTVECGSVAQHRAAHCNQESAFNATGYWIRPMLAKEMKGDV